MSTPQGKRTANLKLTLNRRSVEALVTADKPYIAWDDRLTGFGVRVQPTCMRSYLVNYRADGAGRKAANGRVVPGRHGTMTPERARRMAHETLGRFAAGEDPAGERAGRRATPTRSTICSRIRSPSLWFARTDRIGTRGAIRFVVASFQGRLLVGVALMSDYKSFGALRSADASVSNSHLASSSSPIASASASPNDSGGPSNGSLSMVWSSL